MGVLVLDETPRRSALVKERRAQPDLALARRAEASTRDVDGHVTWDEAPVEGAGGERGADDRTLRFGTAVEGIARGGQCSGR